MCLYTKYILNKKYMYTKKNQGNVPECKDERLRYTPTKCGRCIECRKEKARNWRIRLAEELKNNPDALFITLTFSEESYQKLSWELFKKSKENLNYTEQNEMCKTAVRRWLERIRKKKVNQTLAGNRKGRRLRENTPARNSMVSKKKDRPVGIRIYIHRRLC